MAGLSSLISPLRVLLMTTRPTAFSSLSEQQPAENRPTSIEVAWTVMAGLGVRVLIIAAAGSFKLSHAFAGRQIGGPISPRDWWSNLVQRLMVQSSPEIAGPILYRDWWSNIDRRLVVQVIQSCPEIGVPILCRDWSSNLAQRLVVQSCPEIGGPITRRNWRSSARGDWWSNLVRRLVVQVIQSCQRLVVQVIQSCPEIGGPSDPILPRDWWSNLGNQFP
ncbi:hypothetical protein AVEN_103653-1 [Araneus ventricosus]|uniref:Uncharacterized protein n=1 Tax=Araneus ventricosus TaxID=182803 RepID=A0A4Y2NV19_ARAVE|nr:hypothetical protein AVEN_103653-1 [Araneus ventricosus]